MTRHDWLLLVLAAAEGDTLSPLQLQKSLFLVGHGLAGLVSTDFYDFQPHAYGPFAAAVYHDAESATPGLGCYSPSSTDETGILPDPGGEQPGENARC